MTEAQMTEIGHIDLEGTASKGTWCRINMPNGESSAGEILLMGSDAPELESVIAEIQKDPDLSMADAMLKVVVTAGKDIRGFTNNNVPIQAQDLPELFAKHRKWLVEQCFRHVMSRANYFLDLKGS